MKDDERTPHWASLQHLLIVGTLDGAFTLALTGTIQEQEYQARVLAMARPSCSSTGRAALSSWWLASSTRFCLVQHSYMDQDLAYYMFPKNPDCKNPCKDLLIP